MGRRLVMVLLAGALALGTSCWDATEGGSGGGGSNKTGSQNNASNNGGGGGEICVDGTCVEMDKYESAQKHCVEEINRYRNKKDKPPLDRSAELEQCALEGAISDAKSGTPHGHFQKTGGCNGATDAENEIPGWPKSRYGGVKGVVEEGTKMMWMEGPGGGHYENIIGDHQAVGCGIYVDGSDSVWIVQDFK